MTTRLKKNRDLPPFGSAAFRDLYIRACEALELCANHGTVSDYQEAQRIMLKILSAIPYNKERNFRRHLEWWS